MSCSQWGLPLLVLTIHTASWLTASASAVDIVQPDYSIYLKKNDLLKKVEGIVDANPDMVKLELRHAQDGEYKADLQVVTVEPGGLSPSHKTRARLLIDFGEHGREYITSEVGLRFLQVLTDLKQLEALVGSGKRLERLKAILEHVVFKILPMENIHGRDIVESGQLCERKNGRGVDTNRNWNIDWGKKEKDYDPREEFPGKAPHSEPEVQILLELAKELQPHVWLNVHSGMYALFTPYDHKPSVPNTTDATAALRILQRIKELVCQQCVVGSGGHSVGYLAHGTATDYMFEVLGVPMSFTWEIYGDNSASFEDCFRMFNPLGKQQFDQVVTLWVKALLHLVELLPTHPATWPVFRHVPLIADDATAAAAAAVLAPVNDTAAAAAVVPSPATADKQQQQQQQVQQQQQQQLPATQQASAGGGTQAAVAASSVDIQAGALDQTTRKNSKEAAVAAQSQQQWHDGNTSSSSSDIGSSSNSEEIRIHKVYDKGAGMNQEEEMSAGWVLLHSNRLPLLLLALGGMGVLLYVVTR